APSGKEISSTSSVIAMANTPSLNASSRPGRRVVITYLRTPGCGRPPNGVHPRPRRSGCSPPGAYDPPARPGSTGGRSRPAPYRGVPRRATPGGGDGDGEAG